MEVKKTEPFSPADGASRSCLLEDEPFQVVSFRKPRDLRPVPGMGGKLLDLVGPLVARDLRHQEIDLVLELSKGDLVGV